MNGKIEIQEKRSEERVCFPSEVIVERSDGSVLTAMARDFATKGVGLRHAECLQVGETVQCQVSDAPFQNEFRVEIVWCRETKNGSYESGGVIID